MNLENDEARGISAQQVLSADLYKEAFQVIEERLIAQLAVIEITPQRAEYLRQLLVANRKIKSYLEQVMVTGKMAATELSLLDRVKNKVRSITY